jgi:hypothetical protein
MKSFLEAFQESATGRIFEKENSILLFEAKNKVSDSLAFKSGWKRMLHLKTRPEQLGVDWLADPTDKVPVVITVARTPDSETLFHLAYYELYKQYLLILAKKRGFATGRVLSTVNGGLTVGLAGHTMFLPNTQASKKLLHKRALLSFLSYDKNYGSFVVSQQNAYRKVYKIWTKRLKRITK